MSEHAYEADLIRRIARQLHANEPITTESTDEGFVVQHSRNTDGCTFVGIRIAESVYIVGKMWKKSETIGRNDPKIQTSKNEYVQCDLYRLLLDKGIGDNDEEVKNLAAKIDGKDYEERIDTGYINGYRLKSLKRVLEETFRWYEA